jgi:putative transposase
LRANAANSAHHTQEANQTICFCATCAIYNEDMAFRSNELRRGRVSLIGQTYHVTVTTQLRTPIFIDFWNARAVVSALRHSDNVQLTRTTAFVVMSDHFHWLFELRTDTLSKVVARVKSAISRQLKHDSAIWQSSFHDHAARRDESVARIGEYIIQNPVRAKLVADIGHYSHWYADWI